ncbi:hypothetical protein PVAP13_2NG281100 [Panicum virgatum]|uniref:Uncharacterized protein n=1 Tax=Panicum virgatum TaxID=38727 RepID=A0A8T0VL52_PANVG|nr:hypothetical protein PVAP13_2NG281100 [Panicum virgatum]
MDSLYPRAIKRPGLPLPPMKISRGWDPLSLLHPKAAQVEGGSSAAGWPPREEDEEEGDRAMSDGGVMWRSRGARVGGVALGALAVTATRGDSEFIAATGWIGVQGRRCRGQRDGPPRWPDTERDSGHRPCSASGGTAGVPPAAVRTRLAAPTLHPYPVVSVYSMSVPYRSIQLCEERRRSPGPGWLCSDGEMAGNIPLIDCARCRRTCRRASWRQSWTMIGEQATMGER